MRRCGYIKIPPRIIANKRESHFPYAVLLVLVVSLLGRVPTLRLIGSAWPERQRGKCWKTRVAGFLLERFDIFDSNNYRVSYFVKTRDAGFPAFFVSPSRPRGADKAVRSDATEGQEGGTGKMRFAFIRDYSRWDFSCVRTRPLFLPYFEDVLRNYNHEG